MTIFGIGDSSENCTFLTTKWDEAARMGCKFGITRATTTGVVVAGKPTLKQDLRFVENCISMYAVGMKHYPYCWFDPRVALSSMEQADFFVRTIAKVTPSDIIIVDVENSGSYVTYKADSLSRLKNWLSYVEAATGKRPAIYSYPTFIDSLAILGDISWMKDYPFIVAHWDVTTPRIPYPWYPGSQIGWQYTAYMLGSRYGFYAVDKYHPTPRICLATMEE